MRKDLLRWQWDGYPSFHRDPVNLAIHLVAVPAFGLGVLGAFVALVTGQFLLVPAGLVLAVVAFAAQAVGHKREANPPIPFDGPADAVSRIAVEQSITFWRYVLTGGWWAALRAK
jgi:uncharacterized membrane protein YGL010W